MGCELVEAPGGGAAGHKSSTMDSREDSALKQGEALPAFTSYTQQQQQPSRIEVLEWMETLCPGGGFSDTLVCLCVCCKKPLYINKKHLITVMYY